MARRTEAEPRSLRFDEQANSNGPVGLLCVLAADFTTGKRRLAKPLA